MEKFSLVAVVVATTAADAKHEYSRGYKKFISMISKLMYPKNTRYVCVCAMVEKFCSFYSTDITLCY
jgi:hypothetical protein